jgi:hypothetical protein
MHKTTPTNANEAPQHTQQHKRNLPLKGIALVGALGTSAALIAAYRASHRQRSSEY